MKIPRASIWPTVTFNTTRPDEMAKAEAWVHSLVDGDPAACPVTAPEPPNSTQTPRNPNRSTQGNVVGTLLEAAAAARTSTTYEAPSNWPPPEPGTHESDLLAWAWRAGLDRDNADGLPAGGTSEWNVARDWSIANRKENK